MRQLKISKQITGKGSFAIEKYLQEIGRVRVLMPEEEVELAARIHQGDREAREKLVRGNLRFVVSVAKQYQHLGLSLEDLINEGNVGLLKAVDCFDETKGFKFISYAVWWIRQSMLQAISEHARTVRLPSNKLGVLNKASRCSAALEQELQRAPLPEEVAERMEWSGKEVKECLNLSALPLSLDDPLSDKADGRVLGDVCILSSGVLPTPEMEMDLESLRQDIKRIFALLTQQEAAVLGMFFGMEGYSHPMSLEEIAHALGVTGERVRQVKAKALRRLRALKGAEWLKGYL